MKKSLSLLIAIAMVFGMFASMASAAATTPQEKYDELKAAGIFAGINGQAAPDQDMTRAQFARVAGLLAGLDVDAAPTTKTFTDVAATHWAYQEVEAAVKAGILVGVGNNKFNPSGKVTIQELAVVVAKLLGLAPVADATVAGAAAWAAGYIKAVEAKGIVLPTPYTANATRGALVVASYDAYTALTVPKEAAITKSEQVGAKKLQVTFNKAVDTSKYTVAVKRGTNSVTIASSTWNEAKTVVVIEAASKLITGKHDITIGGVATANLTGSVDAVAEAVKTVEILSDVAVLVDGSDLTRTDDSVADDALQVGYKVTNQFAENITSTIPTSAFNLASSGGVVTLSPSTGTATIQSQTADFLLNSAVSLTIIHVATATVGSKTLTVSNEAKVTDVTVSKLHNANNATLTADSTITDFYLVVEGKDQYGNVASAAKLSSDLLVTVSNPAVATVAGLASNKAVFGTQTVDGVTKTTLQLNASSTGIQAGISVVTFISASSGKSTSFTITVASGLQADNFVFGDVDTVAEGETVNVPVTVTDLAGTEITDIAVLNTGSAGKGVTVSGVTPAGVFTKVDNKVVYQFTAPTLVSPATSGVVTLMAITKNNKVAVKSITINAKAVPAVITGLDSDVKTLIWDEQTVSLAAANLIVEDQYGRVMSDAKFAASFDADGNGATAIGDYKVVVSTDTVTSAVYQAANTDIGIGGTTVSLQGKEKGSEAVTFTIQKFVAGTPNAWSAVAGSDLSISYRTVVQSEIASYGVDDIGKIFNHAAYTKDVSVFGTTSDGKKVTVPTSEFNVVRSLGSGTGATINVAGVAFGTDVDEIKGTAAITINNTGADFSKEYIATDVGPSVAKLEVRNGGSTAVTAINTAFATAHATYNIDDIAEALYVEDQYGKDATVNAVTGVFGFDNGATATPVLAFSSVVNAGGDAPVISGNGTTGATITGVAQGDSFKVRVTNNGKTAEVNVVLF